MKNYIIDILQVLWYDDLKFYPELVDMFDNRIIPNTKLKILFITPYQNVYERLKDYSCIKLCSKEEIQKYFCVSRWIFLHPLSLGKIRTILLPTRIANRIIWRTWGHDIRLEKRSGLLHKIIFKLYVNKVKQFYAIGVDNPIDCENVEKVFGNGINMIQLFYSGSNKQYYEVRKVKNEIEEKKQYVKIMIGHNGSQADNHISLINKMERFKNENVCFSFPLSYGDPINIRKIKEYAECHLGQDKCEFIEKFLQHEEYARYIKSVDIALMDQEYSNALGNIALLIFFHKKIYVNRNSDFARSFAKRNIQVNYTQTINNQSFEQFANTSQYDNKYDEYILHDPINEIDAALNGWTTFINSLYGKEVIKFN